MSLVLGIDTSTTATKAILVDEKGTVVATSAASYGYETPQPLWSEQSPDLWWEGATESIRRVIDESGARPEEIESVGLTGQMHGSVRRGM
jgi:xylulokinase